MKTKFPTDRERIDRNVILVEAFLLFIGTPWYRPFKIFTQDNHFF